MSNAVEIWQIPLQVSESALQSYWRCLSNDEQARADRFHFPDDKRRFTVARGTLRYLLGTQVGRLPHELTFCYGPYGKPSLGQVMIDQGRQEPQLVAKSGSEACDFHFNISHSGELALCVLGGTRRVGIDIEKFKPMQRLESMMERCLSSQEQIEVSATERPAEAFLWRWTCKEAYLKAIGLGLSQSMKTVEVDMAIPRLVRVPQDCPEGWTLHKVDVPKEYAGALVVAGDAPIQFSQWQHALV
ncbi:MAG: 4'-phosphopantetheinyl transferase superfamily protein [Cyanobacteria bacterium J06634_6]